MRIRSVMYFTEDELSDIHSDFRELKNNEIYSIYDFFDIFDTFIGRDEFMLKSPNVNKNYIKNNIDELKKKKKQFEKLFLKYKVDKIIVEE